MASTPSASTPCAAAPGARVIVYSAPGCHLCERALEVVREVCGDAAAVVDISADPELEARYRELIPVVAVDGEPAFTYFVDAHALRALLAS